MFYLGLFLISILYSGYIYLQYKHTNSSYFVSFAIFYGICSQLIWTLSVKNLSNKDVFINGFIWDLVLTVLLVGVPFLISDSIVLNKFQIIGVILMVAGSLLIKV